MDMIAPPDIQDMPNGREPDELPPQGEDVRKLVQDKIKTIKDDKQFHAKAFDRMRRDMGIARNGYDPANWNEKNYTVNITGRHIDQKTAALYAKNPKVTARRRETLDFQLWDEDIESLKMALQVVQLGTLKLQQIAANPNGEPTIDHETGQVVPGPQEPQPQEIQAFQQAQALVEDYQAGMQQRMHIKRLGKTLEVLVAQAMRDQRPVDFKEGMKQVVRRACTTCVGYVELGFQRQYGPAPSIDAQLTDFRTRLQHLENLAEQAQDGEIDDTDAEMAELNASIAALEQQPEIVLSEGLVFDYPQSTKVIPDKLCKTLRGFVGARHLTIEYLFTKDEVKETFGVDLGDSYAAYSDDPKDRDNANQVPDENGSNTPKQRGTGLVCVWKHYDKPSGLVYYVADGFDRFLREPAAPDVFVDDFWPVYALTFNAVENEKELFPLSDVGLMLHSQEEYNRARQGMREHRQMARPRWAYARGALQDTDVATLKDVKPFEAVGLDIDTQADLSKVLQPIPVPGVDPNLYETSQLFTDTQLSVGSQAAQFGGVAKATATESAIAANSTTASDASSIDDLDSFLTSIARPSGQILLKEMSPETVTKVAGRGAFWPEMSLADIGNELFLEVEAGSTGKPNQAVEINNWKEMLPFLIQVPGIAPNWLARETIRRLDDSADLTEALSENLPSIIAQNRAAMGGPDVTPPGASGGPTDQGPPSNEPPAQHSGSGPQFGSNQT